MTWTATPLPGRALGDLVRRLDASAAVRAGAEDIPGWLARRREEGGFVSRRIPFGELRRWSFAPDSGNLVHDTGRFFSIEGVGVRREGEPDWSQPIINQPETGILGILAKEFHGVLHFLMQTKTEPGNIGLAQLGPTVQATRSNYTKVHQGRGTRYIEYFTDPRRGRVLTDTFQSEQGDSFLRKRNRNMVVETTDDVPRHPDHRWLTLGQIHALLALDNVVNMDARTVLSALPPAYAESDAAVLPSTDTEVLSWLTGLKSRHERILSAVPLSRVEGWRRHENEISPANGRHLAVVAAEVEAGNREVAFWTQPLLAARRQGLAALVVRRTGSGVEALVQGLSQVGTFDTVELAPTVQCVTEGYTDLETPPAFLAEVLAAPPERVLFSSLLSEEGGRFYLRDNRYLVIEDGGSFPEEPPPSHRWLGIGQLKRFVALGGHVNVEARTLVTCVQSLPTEQGWAWSS
ncbi:MULTISPECIES: NDP-hexose 2,3-dehydratase family protein [unclassified Streptomyces]|uniref:NDP-hexose 2,3-dehydratase family protein n=1 Tax=unclassified Streptomyces TaxID=2593676 RepID=UPI0024A87D1E|nr:MULTISPECIES: NDP-hexose 2,3-dehydratase family protein [unclassified Streptomyces]